MHEFEHVLDGMRGAPGRSFAERALTAVRTYLGMEVAYLSEFVGDRMVFRAVDTAGFEGSIRLGATFPLQESYCQHILSGQLPELIPDTAKEPLALALPVTHALPIGSHVSVPLQREDGTPYGMFCCLSRSPNPALGARDLGVIRLFADLVAEEVNNAIGARTSREAAEERIARALANNVFAIAYQPIFDLGSAQPSGFEALCRFAAEPYRSPDIWFAEAASVGRQADLELAAIRAALDALAVLPPKVYLSVNAGPETVLDPRLFDLLRAYDPERIVLELTEHSIVGSYTNLVRALAPIRFLGIRLAIDDAGAGYDGLQHVVQLRPDILKLDMTLTRDIDSDPVRRSLAAAMVHFAQETKAVIVAEGIETDAEHACLNALGVHRGQGYLLGRPGPLDTALSLSAPKSGRIVALSPPLRKNQLRAGG